MKYIVLGNYNGHMRHIIARCDSLREAEIHATDALRRDARRMAKSGARLTVEVTKVLYKAKSKGTKNART